MTLNSGFNKLKSADFVSQVERIVTAMTGNTAFPEPWPANVPTLAQIQADLAAFQAEATATSAGDRTRIATRKAARSKLQSDMTLLAYYLQSASQGDETLLSSTGFPLRAPVVQARIADVPAAPTDFLLTRGPLSGTLMARVRRVPKAGSYDAQVTAADPTVEANWTAAGSFKNSSRIELSGLTPGKVYYVRVRALGSGGPGAWTIPASLMVV